MISFYRISNCRKNTQPKSLVERRTPDKLFPKMECRTTNRRTVSLFQWVSLAGESEQGEPMDLPADAVADDDLQKVRKRISSPWPSMAFDTYFKLDFWEELHDTKSVCRSVRMSACLPVCLFVCLSGTPTCWVVLLKNACSAQRAHWITWERCLLDYLGSGLLDNWLNLLVCDLCCELKNEFAIIVGSIFFSRHKPISFMNYYTIGIYRYLCRRSAPPALYPPRCQASSCRSHEWNCGCRCISLRAWSRHKMTSFYKPYTIVYCADYTNSICFCIACWQSAIGRIMNASCRPTLAWSLRKACNGILSLFGMTQPYRDRSTCLQCSRSLCMLVGHNACMLGDTCMYTFAMCTI